MTKHYIVLFLTITCLLGCKKKNDEFPQTGNFIVHLTDSPADYDHIYLDIQSIEVNHSSQGWIKIGPTVPGILDILKFNNTFDTLIANAELPVGSLGQIRMVLGSNNTIVVNGITKNLIIPSGGQSGLKINISASIEAEGITEHWLDFKAGSSIIELGNGNYHMIPVLRSFSAQTNGKIVGYALPLNANAYVQLFRGTDTLTTVPEADGFFGFSGIQGSNYNLRIVPTMGSYQDSILPVPEINGNQLHNAGNIVLNP